MQQTTSEAAGKPDVMIKADHLVRRLWEWFNANPAFAIAIAYVAVASLWILFSDKIAEWLFPEGKTSAESTADQSPGQGEAPAK